MSIIKNQKNQQELICSLCKSDKNIALDISSSLNSYPICYNCIKKRPQKNKVSKKILSKKIAVKKNTNSPKSKIFSFDFETYYGQKKIGKTEKKIGFVYFWCLDCEDGRHWEGVGISSFLKTVENVKEKKLIYGFNSRKFDLLFLLPEMLKITPHKNIKSIWGDEGILYLNYKKDNKFLDASKFYGGRLESWIKNMNRPDWEEIKSHPQRWGTQKLGHVASEHEKSRCRIDSLATLELAKKIKQKAKGIPYLTQWSWRFNDWKSTLSEEKLKNSFPQSKWLDEKFRPFYSGGLTDNLNEATYRKPVWFYDNNNLYPWVMLNCKLPFGMPIRRKTEKYNYGAYMIDCKKVKCSVFPFLQININYLGMERKVAPQYLINQTLFLWEPEFNLFKKYYHGKWKIKEQYFFQSSNQLFTEYLTPWKEIKENSEKGTLEYSEAKYIGLTLYGKFGQKSERVAYRLKRARANEKLNIKYYDTNRNYLTPRQEETIIPCFRYLPIAGAITAEARSQLVEMIIKIGYKNVLYYDTDSLILKKPLLDEYVHPKKQGKWKLLGEYLGYSSRGPKSYYLITDKSKKHYDVVVNKGLPIAGDDMNFADYIKNEKIFHEAKISRKDGTGVEIYDVESSIPSFSDSVKRIYNNGFWNWITTIPPNQRCS